MITWEIVSAKPDGAWAGSQFWIAKAAQSGSWTRMATENASLCARMNADCVRRTANGDTRIRGEFDLLDPRRSVRG
jgi:hypothetical protein